jgi:branched-chain amino acid transport system substrate-binding protein
MLQGLKVAVEDINKNGGVLGHPVALDYQSDASDPTKVQLALQSIFTPDKVHRIIFMLPNVIPTITDTVMQYTQKYGIPSFDPGSGGDIFNLSTHPDNYSIYPADNVQVPAYVAGFEKLKGSSSAIKLGVLSDTEQADQQLSTLIIDATKAAGGKSVGEQQVDPTATDVSVQMSQLTQAGANVILVQASGNLPVEAAQAMESMGNKTVKIVVSPAAVNAQTQTAIPKSVAPQFFTLGEQVYLRNSEGTGPLPQYKAFASELAKTQGGIDDLEISANIRDAAVLDAWAVNHAGSTSLPKVTKVLNNLKASPPPAGTLVWMPNPLWTSTDHTFDHADLSSTFWALISPGHEVEGTLTGSKLTVSPALANIANKVASTTTTAAAG